MPLRRVRLLSAGILAGPLILMHAPAALAIEVWSNCRTGTGPPTYHELAEQVAPVLWFSPDEPLLGPSRDIEKSFLPAALPVPGQDPATSKAQRVAYYRVSQFRTTSAYNSPADRQALPVKPGANAARVSLDRISVIRIRFLFYYPDDVGFGGHQHDLESVEMTLEVERSPTPRDTCASIRLRSIAGAAHGSDWYSNVLHLDDHIDDAVYPPHVLVEEGKHASAPDRNGDGWYMPGYDSTRNTNDAWGVRDTLRNARLGGRLYHAENAKDRASSPQKVVPLGWQGRRYGSTRAPLIPEDRAWPSYILVEAATGESAAYCRNGKVAPLPHAQRFLEKLLAQWRFCADTPVKGPKGFNNMLGERVWAGPMGPLEATRRDRLTFGYVYRAGNGLAQEHAFTVNAGGAMRLSLSGGWLVPRLHVTSVGAHGDEDPQEEAASREWSLGADLLYTPSGSRIVDWYAALGVDGLASAGTNDLAQEFGVKLRFTSGPLSGINSLLGLRFGYRGPLHRDLAGGRWVFEAGLGGW